MVLARYRHIIVLDVLNNDSSVGFKGELQENENRLENPAKGQESSYVGADTHLPPYFLYLRFLLKMDIRYLKRSDRHMKREKRLHRAVMQLFTSDIG